MVDVFSGIVDEKIRKILDIFIKNKGELFHLKKISRLSNVPLSSSFRLVKNLVNYGLINIVKVGEFKLYKLAENKKTNLIQSIWGK